MSLLKRSHHKRAEAHLDAAASLVVAAGENVKLAVEANTKAAEAHMTAIDYHSERLAETQKRSGEISEWQTVLSDLGVGSNG